MATYPVEFHRRLEQKWESRIEQILSVTGTVPPPRRPNNDYESTAKAIYGCVHAPQSARSTRARAVGLPEFSMARG
jgi:hypothetical protein